MNPMKLAKRMTAVCLVALVAAFTFAVLPAYAAKGEAYDYTVRVWPGNVGACSSGEYLVNDGIATGSETRFSLNGDASELSFGGGTIAVADDRYYIKGVRVGGEDALGKMVNTVTSDMDFVVAYGVRGDMVSYTVNFVEYGTSNTVTSDQGVSSVTFTGKKGDKVVVPYEYVPGYRPRYLNITFTLGDEGSNTRNLEYIPLTADEQAATEGGTTTGGTTTGGTTTGGTTTGGTAAGGTEGGAAGAAGGTEGGAAGGTAGTAGTTEGASAAAPPATEEIGDVDNPLASGSNAKDDNKLGVDSKGTASENKTPGLPVATIIGIIAALVVIIAIIAAILSRMKKGKA